MAPGGLIPRIGPGAVVADTLIPVYVPELYQTASLRNSGSYKQWQIDIFYCIISQVVPVRYPNMKKRGGRKGRFVTTQSLPTKGSL